MDFHLGVDKVSVVHHGGGFHGVKPYVSQPDQEARSGGSGEITRCSTPSCFEKNPADFSAGFSIVELPKLPLRF